MGGTCDLQETQRVGCRAGGAASDCGLDECIEVLETLGHIVMSANGPNFDSNKIGCTFMVDGDEGTGTRAMVVDGDEGTGTTCEDSGAAARVCACDPAADAEGDTADSASDGTCLCTANSDFGCAQVDTDGSRGVCCSSGDCDDGTFCNLHPDATRGCVACPLTSQECANNPANSNASSGREECEKRCFPTEALTATEISDEGSGAGDVSATVAGGDNVTVVVEGSTLEERAITTTEVVDWSEDTTTAAPLEGASVIEGSFTLNVANAEGFASDPTVESALKAAVAAGSEGVDAALVFITRDEVFARGRALRQLQDGSVRVVYSVEVPPDVDAADVADVLGDMQPAEFTSAINAALEDAGADMDAFGVAVDSVVAPAIVFLAADDGTAGSDSHDRSDQSEDFSSWDEGGGAGRSGQTALLLLAAAGAAAGAAAARP